jgi:hypothetical protein
LYLAFVAVVSAVSFCFVFGTCGVIGQSNSSWFVGWHPFILFLGRLIVTTAVVGMIVRLMPIKWTQRKSIWRYPPTLLGVFVGFLVACVLDWCGALGAADARPPWWEWLLLAIFGLSIVQAIRLISETPSPQESDDSEDSGLLQPIDFESWVGDETPSKKDGFNRLPIAQRFARHLLAPAVQDRTLGLVGDSGSGKSTIVGWVKQAAKASQKANDPELWICEVSCWGFEDSTSAVQHILSSAIKEVSKHADCFSVRNVPDAYRKALSAGGSWWPAVADLFLEQPGPTDALKRLTPILKSMNAHLVIVVEDLDRNPSAKFDIQEVQATLQRLRSVPGVSFILTGGSSASSKIDFARLCDHIESIPPMGEEFVLELIRALRRKCLSMGDVNPNESQERSETDLWGNVREREYANASFGLDEMTMARAVLKLLLTPRDLKHVLRKTRAVWVNLRGEIDFDDLFVVNVLLRAAPEAFNFLLQRMDQLRFDLSRPTQQHAQERLEKRMENLRDEWKQATKGVEWDLNAALTLICFLVPNADQIFFGNALFGQSFPPCPQGVRHASPTDYWRRLLAEELSNGEIRDQEVLRAIEEWVASLSLNGALIKRLATEKPFALVWKHFAERIPGTRFLQLAEQVIGTVLNRERSRASDAIPGICAVLNSVGLNRADHDTNRQWLENEIRISMPWSLWLACDLYDDWTDCRNGFVRPEDVEKIRRTMVEAAKERFTESDPQTLLRTLDETCPYTIRWLVLPPDNSFKRSILRDPKDWKWFAPVLLAAAKLDPKKMIPQIGNLVVDRDANARDRQANVTIIIDQVRAMFGDRTRELLRLLTTEIEPTNEEAATFLRKFREQAQELLSKKPEVDGQASDEG